MEEVRRKLSEIVGVGKQLLIHQIWELDAYRKSGEFPRAGGSKTFYEQRAEDEALAALRARDKRLNDICTGSFDLPVFIKLPQSMWHASRCGATLLKEREWSLFVNGKAMVACRPGHGTQWRIEIDLIRLINLYEAVVRDPEMYMEPRQGPDLMTFIKEAWERCAVSQGFLPLESWRDTPNNVWDSAKLKRATILRLEFGKNENTASLTWVQYEILKLLYLDYDDNSEYMLLRHTQRG